MLQSSTALSHILGVLYLSGHYTIKKICKETTMNIFLVLYIDQE